MKQRRTFSPEFKEQVWRCREQPGVVAAVPGAGGHVPGLQRGTGGEAEGDPT